MDQQCRIGQVVVVGEGDNQLEPPEAKERCLRVWKREFLNLFPAFMELQWKSILFPPQKDLQCFPVPLSMSS